MTGSRRHRHVGTALGPLVVAILLMALFGLGGRGGGDPAGRPESLHRGTPHSASIDRAATPAADGARLLPDLDGVLPSAPVALGMLLALIGLVLARPLVPLAARPIPARAGRGPPRRLP